MSQFTVNISQEQLDVIKELMMYTHDIPENELVEEFIESATRIKSEKTWKLI